MENTFYVPKTYSIHATFKDSKYMTNVYGIKNLEDIKFLTTKMITSGLFSNMYYTETWKVTRRGRWIRHEYQVPR